MALVVDQILDQTYPNIEVVVTDDGDPGPTRDALSRFGRRIRYEANERRLGIYGNWNRAISLARGELVAVYHDHDGYARTMVERSVDLFRRSPRVGVVHVAAMLVVPGAALESALHPELPEIADGRWFAEKQAWQWGSYVAHGAMMVRRELYERLGVFDESRGIVADMDMLIRFALECDVGYVREPLYSYVGRAPGDALFGFRWRDLEDYIPQRRLNLERVYAREPAKLSKALAALQRQVDRRLLRSMLYLSVQGEREQVDEGWPVLARFASRPAYLGARALVSESTPIRASRAMAYGLWRRRHHIWPPGMRALAGAFTEGTVQS
ncbi:MAG: glycosyltransferase [Myxococcales bacterium]|nr:glycosyltransferase [Myxococcales bacterium]